MARNMHGVDQDNETVQRIARESGASAGFIVGIIEFYTDAVGDDTAYTFANKDGLDVAIVMSAQVAAFTYKDQDDEDDVINTERLKAWARSV